MEVKYNEEIFTINDERVELVKKSYKLYKKQFITYEIKKIQLRYIINVYDCKTNPVVEIIDDESSHYYIDNGEICLSINPEQNGIFTNIIHEINSKPYDYIFYNVCYKLFGNTYKSIDSKSNIGEKIKKLYSYIENKKNVFSFNNYSMELIIIDEPIKNFGLIVKMQYENDIEYFEEESTHSYNILPQTYKDKTYINTYKLDKHAYEYLDYEN